MASLAFDLLSQAFNAPDRKRSFDSNEGLVDAVKAAEIVASIIPSRSRTLLEDLVMAEEIREYYRGAVLLAYSRAFGSDARPLVLHGLRDPELRRYAAQAMESLSKGKNESTDVSELCMALQDEERPDVVAEIAKALLAVGPEGLNAVSSLLDRTDPWTRVELSWRIDGGTDRELADLLTEAGVMDSVSDKQLVETFSDGFDLRKLIWAAGGGRLVMFDVKTSSDMEHFDLFQQLLKATRPTVAVEDLKESCTAKLLREPEAKEPRIEKITDLGTVCTVSFQYQGKRFSFDTYPQGRWHDVAGVMKGFDNFMKDLGRDDRCYELKEGGDYGLFVLAPASKFEPLVKRLGIPLEQDSESARDAAKAYQRKVQQM
ncbi:MAG: hypothetical protein FJ267_12290 [Planctomycetes bacterium]|nr:hypothetical protein [Planctomycetota bacterium]